MVRWTAPGQPCSISSWIKLLREVTWDEEWWFPQESRTTAVRWLPRDWQRFILFSWCMMNHKIWTSFTIFIWWQLKYFVFSPHTWGNDPFLLKLFEGMTLWVRKCPRLKDIQPLQRLFRRDEGIRESFHKMTRTFKDSKVVDFFGCFGIRFRWFRIYLWMSFVVFLVWFVCLPFFG